MTSSFWEKQQISTIWVDRKFDIILRHSLGCCCITWCFKILVDAKERHFWWFIVLQELSLSHHVSEGILWYIMIPDGNISGLHRAWGLKHVLYPNVHDWGDISRRRNVFVRNRLDCDNVKEYRIHRGGYIQPIKSEYRCLKAVKPLTTYFIDFSQADTNIFSCVNS